MTYPQQREYPSRHTLSPPRSQPREKQQPTINSHITEKFKTATITTKQPMTMEMKRATMLLTHDHPAAGHPGHGETIRKAQSITTWNGMNEWITEYIKGCATCQQNKIQTHKAKIPPFCIDTVNNTLPFQ